jgi:hypothetical protein
MYTGAEANNSNSVSRFLPTVYVSQYAFYSVQILADEYMNTYKGIHAYENCYVVHHL